MTLAAPPIFTPSTTPAPGPLADPLTGGAPTIGDLSTCRGEEDPVVEEREPPSRGEHDTPLSEIAASSDPFDDFDDDDFDDEFDDDFEEDWDDDEEDDGFGPEFQDSEGEEFDVNADVTDEELEDEDGEEGDKSAGGKSAGGKFSGDDDFDE